jgi:hypothetical protein
MPEFDSTVEYRKISDFPNYRVGSDGSVWSCCCIGSRNRRTGSWRRLVTCPDSAGYPLATFRSAGVRRSIRVHTLVLEAFVGPRPEGQECRHLDGNPANCCLGNVRWGTHRENMEDRARHDRNPRGARQGNAKLTEDAARAILASTDRSRGWCTRLARQYGVSQSHISHIIRRKTWCHL